MKKHGIVLFLSAALTLSLLFSLSGCGKNQATDAAELFGADGEAESITPAPPEFGGGESMGPMYTPYAFEEADSAGLTSPVFPAPGTKDAAGVEAQSPASVDGESAETSGGSGDGVMNASGTADAANASGAASTSGATGAANTANTANASAAGTPDAATASEAYKQGYAAGEAAGYAQGYKAGYDEGGGVGYNNGYKAGRTAGYAEIAGIVTSRIADNAD